jgi:hypothetical protein
MERRHVSELVAGALAALAASTANAAGSDAPAPRLASLTVENDLFVGFDRHYTNGVQAAFLVDLESLPAAIRTAPPFAWSADRDFVAAMGQRIFTPADTTRAAPDPRDRPYAGWLYVMTDLRVRSGEVIDHLLLSVGVVGPAARGKQAQNTVHRILHVEPARGWDSQIGDRATVLASYERAWRSAATEGRLAGLRVDLTPRVGATVGNVLTYASAGAVLRYGSELPADLPATHISLGPPRDGYRGSPRPGWYAWCGIDARAVARNIFLDGAGGSPGVERRKFGFDVQAGAVLVGPRWRVGFAVVQRSREFASQDTHDRFAQLTISFPY